MVLPTLIWNIHITEVGIPAKASGESSLAHRIAEIDLSLGGGYPDRGGAHGSFLKGIAPAGERSPAAVSRGRRDKAHPRGDADPPPRAGRPQAPARQRDRRHGPSGRVLPEQTVFLHRYRQYGIALSQEV